MHLMIGAFNDILTNCFRVPMSENTGIRIKSFKDLRSFFQPTVRSMIHCAVQRNFPSNYMHHYIVLGHTWHENFKNCYIIHVSSGGECSKGRVKRELYSEDQFENDTRNGLYVYQSDEYPKNDEDYLKAYDRFEKREGETDYSISLKNCEHLVYYILTGCGVSHQLRGSTCLRRCFSDFIDLFTINKHKTLCKVVFRFLSMRGIDLYLENKMKDDIKIDLKFINVHVHFVYNSFQAFTLSFEEFPVINYMYIYSFENCRFDLEIVLKFFWQKVRSGILRYIATRSCFIRGIGEISIACKTIMFLKREREKGTVNPEDFQREVVKAVCSCIFGVIDNYVTADFLFVRYANHFQHSKFYFLAEIFVESVLSQFIGRVLGEICFRLCDRAMRLFNRPHDIGNQRVHT